MPTLDHLGTPSLWAIAMMFLTAVVFLYRKDSSSCEECKKELNTIRIQLLTEAKNSSEALLAAHQKYTSELETMSAKYTDVISRNITAMEGMRDNFFDLRSKVVDAVEASGEPPQKPPEKKRGHRV